MGVMDGGPRRIPTHGNYLQTNYAILVEVHASNISDKGSSSPIEEFRMDEERNLLGMADSARGHGPRKVHPRENSCRAGCQSRMQEVHAWPLNLRGHAISFSFAGSTNGNRNLVGTLQPAIRANWVLQTLSVEMQLLKTAVQNFGQ